MLRCVIRSGLPTYVPLHYALEQEANAAVVTVLIESGSEVNAPDAKGRLCLTP